MFSALQPHKKSQSGADARTSTKNTRDEADYIAGENQKKSSLFLSIIETLQFIFRYVYTYKCATVNRLSLRAHTVGVEQSGQLRLPLTHPLTQPVTYNCFELIDPQLHLSFTQEVAFSFLARCCFWRALLLPLLQLCCCCYCCCYCYCV